VPRYADPGPMSAECVAYRGPDPPVTACHQGYFPVEPEQKVRSAHRDVGCGESNFMKWPNQW
jgi:hypothetical protein